MKILQRTRVPALSLLAGLLLTSCGGGDPYAGLWLGKMSPQREAAAMVLDDGNYYLLYSQPNNPALLGGVVQGTADFHAATVTSTDAVDYNWERLAFPPVSGQATTLTARVSPRMSVSGSVNGRTVSAGHVRDDDEARIADIAGSHTGNVVFALGPRPATFVVTATGQVSTVINACQITGTVTPRMEANAFDLTMTLGGWPCVFENVTFKGVAFYRKDQRQLYAAVVNPMYRHAIGFTGFKQ